MKPFYSLKYQTLGLGQTNWGDKFGSICSIFGQTKSQLISKCLFVVFTFFQKRTKTSQQVVKLNLFVPFLEEMWT
jgi:hypothetical protein